MASAAQQWMYIVRAVFNKVIALKTRLDVVLLPELQKHGRFPLHPFSYVLGENKYQQYKNIKRKKDAC